MADNFCENLNNFQITFQAILIAFLSITLFIFTMSAMFSPTTLKKFGTELGNIDEKATAKEQANRRLNPIN